VAISRYDCYYAVLIRVDYGHVGNAHTAKSPAIITTLAVTDPLMPGSTAHPQLLGSARRHSTSFSDNTIRHKQTGEDVKRWPGT